MDQHLHTLRQAAWHRFVIGLNKGQTPFLPQEAEDFLKRDDFRTSDPRDLGIRAALIDLGYLQADQFGRVKRRRDPLPIRGRRP